MSEDIDFRVILKPSGTKHGKDAKRKKLRDFRYALISALRHSGFNIPDDAVNVLYEGRFMQIIANFGNSHKSTYLRPYIEKVMAGEELIEPRLVNSLFKRV